jgi:hypothetical protein
MRRLVAAVTSCVALVVAGCSSSAQPAATSTPPASSAAAGRPADPATTAAVRRAYAAFFSSKASLAQSQAALQHGAAFTAAIREQGAGPHGQQSSASVSSVSLSSPDVADVQFSITSNGITALRDVPGKAVRENGTWKVAATTFCQLLSLEGSAPKACDDPSITALPR